jgi:hypothetical protein
MQTQIKLLINLAGSQHNNFTYVWGHACQNLIILKEIFNDVSQKLLA